MAGNILTQQDIDRIYEEISTKCAFYTDQVQFGVEIALNAIVVLLQQRSEEFEVIGLRTVSET